MQDYKLIFLAIVHYKLALGILFHLNEILDILVSSPKVFFTSPLLQKNYLVVSNKTYQKSYKSYLRASNSIGMLCT